jgi:hypothetical protein
MQRYELHTQQGVTPVHLWFIFCRGLPLAHRLRILSRLRAIARRLCSQESLSVTNLRQ